MSFSFRNIFSPDESEFEASPESGSPNGFSPSGVPVGRTGLSGNDAGSGAAAANVQSFLAGELLAFIPPAISARSGIPMEKELKVPLPADGSLDVKLSTLYQLCPELFAAEITPLNDSTVALPPRLGATPATESTVPARVQSSVFSKPGRAMIEGKVDNEGTNAGNPFWSPVTPVNAAPVGIGEVAETSAPSLGAGKEAPALPSAIENPFSAQPVPVKNAFAQPETATTPDSGFVAGGFDAPTAASPGGNALGAFEAAAASGFVGFDEKTSLKNEAGGQEGRPKANPFESNEGFATLFSKQAETDSSIPFPIAGIPFAGGAKSAEPEGVWGAMFSGTLAEDDGIETSTGEGFAPAPFESIGNLLKQSTFQVNPAAAAAQSPGFAVPAKSATPPLDEAADVFSGFASEAKTPESAPEGESTTASQFEPGEIFGSAFSAFVAPASEEIAETSSLQTKDPEIKWSFESKPEPPPIPSTPPVELMNPVPTAFQAPEAFALPEAFAPPVATAPPAPPFALPQGFGPAPVETAPAVSPAEPVREPAPAPAPVPDPFASFAPPAARLVEATPSPAPSSPVQEESAAMDEVDTEEQYLELRAIFSTDESFTLSKVARKVVGLPGINSCSLSTPGKLVQASRREENRLGNEAREMVSTLRSLAKLTGLPEARTFTLQTDRGIVSLFLEGECCVTVHQDSATFQPGVREKLILIARSLVKLRE